MCTAHGGTETIQVAQDSLPVVPSVHLQIIPDVNPFPPLSSRCSTEDGDLISGYRDLDLGPVDQISSRLWWFSEERVQESRQKPADGTNPSQSRLLRLLRQNGEGSRYLPERFGIPDWIP